jgi:hypothetical protein
MIKTLVLPGDIEQELRDSARLEPETAGVLQEKIRRAWQPLAAEWLDW